MRIITLISIVLFAFPIFGQFDSGLYGKYNKAIENGNFRKAKKELIKISQKEKNTLIKLLIIGQFHGVQNELDSAKHYLTMAIDYSKSQPISFTDENFISIRDSLYEVSISIYDKIISEEPIGENFCHRGVFKADIGYYQGALVDFHSAIRMDSSDYTTYYNMGLTYRRANKLDSALRCYDLAIRLYPEYGAAHMNKAFIYMKIDSFQYAIEQFELAVEYLEGTKDHSYCINNIGFCHYKLEDYSKAEEMITRSINMNSINSYAYKNLALVYIALDDKKSACRAIRNSIELGFTSRYGSEVLELKSQHCDK
jgi:tetratricopeptide (TPR) repeat protein